MTGNEPISPQFVELGDGFAVAAPGRRVGAVFAGDRPALDESLTGAVPADPLAAALDTAAAASGLVAGRTVVVTAESAPEAPAADVTLFVPPPAPGNGQVLRYQDAAGLWHWRLPDAAPDASADPQPPQAASGAELPASPRFVVPAAAFAAPADAAPETDESLLGAVARKIVHQFVVYAYPIVDRVLDPFVDNVAQQREIDSHPYGIRTFTPDNYTQPYPPDAQVATADDWARFTAGRTLLLLHGTFSTSHGGFGGLDAATIAELNTAYDGRVLAFDHPTVSVSLAANIDRLLALTGTAGPIEVDILAHSRGGLVARELIRRQSAPGAVYRVRRVVFAATPNRGTALADPDHVTRFIDRYTNLLALLPGPAAVVGDTLAGLLTAVQLLGHAALADLDGLGAMRPGGASLAALAAGAPDAEFYAVNADFEPDGPLLAKLRAADLLMDAVFPEANDLVVPTEGVVDMTPGSAAGFPIPADRLVHFPAPRAVWHCTLFGEPETRAKLVEWLRP